MRAYIIEGLPSAEVARRFGYTPHAFRMLCYNFRRGELSDFFVVKRSGPRQQPRRDKVRNVVVELRKRNYSIYDISRELKEQGKSFGPTAVRQILAEEGFAPLPRRLDEERPVGVGRQMKPLPMFVTSSSPQESSPPGLAASSYSFRI